MLKRWSALSGNGMDRAARRAYVLEAATTLVGVFPGARVNASAYAAALAEDMSDHTADISERVFRDCRRRCKTLPAIASMLEAAEAETKRRHLMLRKLERQHTSWQKRHQLPFIRRMEDLAQAVSVALPSCALYKKAAG